MTRDLHCWQISLLSMREIITLQIGSFSNFVGSHLWNIQDEFSTQHGNNSIVRNDALYQAREFRGKTLYTPRCLILDVDESLGSMSKEGYFSYQSASDVEALSEYAASSWGGNVSISRFEAVPKVPFQRTLEESFQLHTSSSRSSSASNNPTLDLIRTKRSLIESKKSELAAMNGELTTKAKAGTAEGSYLFDLQRKIGELEAEIVALTADIERRMHLYKVMLGEEVDKDVEFDLNESKYWTDYNKTFWHPTCLNTLKGLSLSSPIDVYSTEYLTPEEFEQYFDHFRHHIEQADQLEGLHVLVDCDTTFGAMSTAILEEVKDEFGKMQTIAFPIFSLGGPSIGQSTKDTLRIRRMNRAMTLSSLHSSSALVLPFDCGVWKNGASFPHLDSLQLANPYHTSAIIASTIDSLTLPYRLQSNGPSMRQFVDSLVSNASNNFGLVSTSLPLPLSSSNTLSRQFFGYDIYSNPETRTDEERISASTKKILPHASWMTSVLPFSHSTGSEENSMQDTSKGVALPWGESVVLRGVPAEFALDPSDPSEYHAPNILYHYLKRYPCASRQMVAEQEGSSIPIAYPKFFQNKAFSSARSAPTLTHVQNTARLADFFDYLTVGVTSDIALKYPTLNYDTEKILAARDSLLTLQEDYSQ